MTETELTIDEIIGALRRAIAFVYGVVDDRLVAEVLLQLNTQKDAARSKTVQELRQAAQELRRTSMPLGELIPLLQRAADLLDSPGDPRNRLCYAAEASALSRAQEIAEDVAAAATKGPGEPPPA